MEGERGREKNERKVKKKSWGGGQEEEGWGWKEQVKERKRVREMRVNVCGPMWFLTHFLLWSPFASQLSYNLQ